MVYLFKTMIENQIIFIFKINNLAFNFISQNNYFGFKCHSQIKHQFSRSHAAVLLRY